MNDKIAVHTESFENKANKLGYHASIGAYNDHMGSFDYCNVHIINK